jgi:tetratricopeptide (TPR) repeat protein
MLKIMRMGGLPASKPLRRFGNSFLLVRSYYEIGILSFIFLGLSNANSAEFVGSSACAKCHVTVAGQQEQSAMALTWRGSASDLLPGVRSVIRKDAPGSDWSFEMRRLGDAIEVSSEKSAGEKIAIPVRVVMGGRRHGLSFLAGIDELDGIPLERPALVEARFAWSAKHGELVLSPGFPEEAPRTLDTALGIALSPTLEKKCVTCHGEPSAYASGKTGGVHCENCHGAGSDHLLAVGRKAPREGIVNPARLDADARMAVCAQCHTGFSRQSDPLPDDLLVSNQVNALSNSECFIQSGKTVGCTSCHDPHGDAAEVQAISVRACVGCHSPVGEKHAAVCPVNAKSACIGCHMPSIQKGAFQMVDHWIRVHPEQNVKADASKRVESRVESREESKMGSKVQPLREFLRVIATTNRADADAANARLARGDAFFDVARELSKDPTAPIGGYLGPMQLSQLDPRLAQPAGSLAYAQASQPIDMGDHWILLQRLPRDFKYDAGLLYEQAVAQRAKGDLPGALGKYQQALVLYPNFLRALLGMGTAFVESGNIPSGAGVLNYAVQTYPDDAAAQFNFGITLGGLDRHTDEIAAYRRAIELDPDLDAAYENLGAALSANGDSQGAIEVFRKGLGIDPLSAVLYYDLSLVLDQAGDRTAERALKLAIKIDPAIAKRQKN